MVLILMGSDSDLPIMKKAAEVLERFGVPHYMTVASAHRTPDRVERLVKEAEAKGTKVIIAGAGGAAHLPGVVAALSTLPVIGVPIKTSSLNGLDSLFSIVQMPAGIPVATVAINGAENAALLAIAILSTSDENLARKLKEYREEMKKKVEEKAEKLDNLGYKAYIENFLNK
jgi:5-(carboxyamino)imidazole ribonucleotide mutase